MTSEDSRSRHPSQRTTSALQSLLVDEGAGVPLAAAAGDVAASRTKPSGYSARTQAATVVAYHVMGHQGIDRDDFVSEMAALDDPTGSVYVSPSQAFRDWLDSIRDSGPVASSGPDPEAATRAVPIGVWFRTDPDGLVRTTIEAARVEHLNAASITAAVAAAGAVAASSLAMAGRDLVYAVGETASRALAAMEVEQYRYAGVADAGRLADALFASKGDVGMSFASALARYVDLGICEELAPVLASVLVAANPEFDPVLTIDDAARMGGVDAAVITGALMGGRVGLRRWPWSVPNETWFAEIGRRLVAHETELRDIPIPYAVEQRMLSSVKVDPKTEMG